jgi:predicted PurR-regulated permease PerM
MPGDKDIARRVDLLVLTILALAGVGVCILLAAPFLSAFTWALTLAILFMPLHVRIERALDRPNTSAILTVLVIALAITIPIALVLQRLITEAANSASLVEERLSPAALRRFIDDHPSLSPIALWVEQYLDLHAILASVASWLSTVSASFAGSSLFQVIGIVLTFYLLFYFLRNRVGLQGALRDWLPLSKSECDQLFQRVVDIVHATVYGTLAIALVQGVFGSVFFWLLGLSTPLFWGVLLGAFTIVPVVGSFVVWVPMVAAFALNGDWEKAAILALYGVLVVIGLMNNLLYPMILGNRLQLHLLPAFIAMIGGLLLFGAAGIILGPLAVTTTLLLLGFWRARAEMPPHEGEVAE